MDDKIQINLQMAGSSYPLIINREEEEIIRKAAKEVDDMFTNYRERDVKKGYSPLQLMTMIAYQFSLRRLQLEEINDTKPYTDKIKELTEELETYFKEQ